MKYKNGSEAKIGDRVIGIRKERIPAVDDNGTPVERELEVLVVGILVCFTRGDMTQCMVEQVDLVAGRSGKTRTDYCMTADLLPAVVAWNDWNAGRCKKCGERMAGFGDEYSDCAFPILKEASASASLAVEEAHYQRTGERKTAGDIMRNIINRACGAEE